MDFKEIKNTIKEFVEKELFSLEPWILDSSWEEKLPKLNELEEKLKRWGFGSLKSQKNMED